MTSALASLILTMSAVATGGLFDRTVAVIPAGPNGEIRGDYAAHHLPHGVLPPGGRILVPGPGPGWGFPNGNPDGYGWVDYGTALPLGANRTPDYFFPRNFAVLPEQVFYPQYYNPYVQRGQRYIPYTGGGGAHPNGGPPPASAWTPIYPDRETDNAQPLVDVPTFSGEVDAPPIPSTGGGVDR